MLRLIWLLLSISLPPGRSPGNFMTLSSRSIVRSNLLRKLPHSLQLTWVAIDLQWVSSFFCLGGWKISRQRVHWCPSGCAQLAIRTQMLSQSALLQPAMPKCQRLCGICCLCFWCLAGHAKLLSLQGSGMKIRLWISRNQNVLIGHHHQPGVLLKLYVILTSNHKHFRVRR